jgi:hypothetical protein
MNATMRTLAMLAALLVVLVQSDARGQFKSQVEEQARISDAFIHDPGPSLLFGWFDPNRFHMNHSIMMSYQSFAGGGISLGTYTNSMRYDFAENLSARADVSMSYSPYNSFAGSGQNDLSGIYLSRAEVNYMPWDNVFLQVQYRNMPFGYGYGYYSPFYSPWLRETGY